MFVKNHPDISVPSVWCQKVSKWHGKILALNELSLELRPGITALLGANGAGKSTLLSIVAGISRPSLGTVRVFGKDPWIYSSKRMIGFCPDHDSYPRGVSVVDFLGQMAELSGLQSQKASIRINDLMEKFSISSFREIPVPRCSLGNRQKVKLACSLLTDANLLVLDEPFRGIDPLGRRDLVQILDSLSREGKTILLSSHELPEIQKLTNRVVFLRSGRITCAGPLGIARQTLDDCVSTLSLEFDSENSRANLATEVIRQKQSLLSLMEFSKTHETKLLLKVTRLEDVLEWLTTKVADTSSGLVGFEVLEESDTGKTMSAFFKNGLSG